MKIVTIEPTPSPNVMKLIIEPSLTNGISYNFRKEQKQSAPEHIRKLLDVEGVKAIFQVADFISVERHPKVDWKQILPDVQRLFGSREELADDSKGQHMDQAFAEVKIEIQKLKGIPIQVKLTRGTEEKRFGLPERFTTAMMAIQKGVSNYVYERRWLEQSPRYGDLQEIGAQLVEELVAAYSEKRLSMLVDAALHPEMYQKVKTTFSTEQVRADFSSSEWETRFAALDQWEVALDGLDILEKAIEDPQTSIRRQAVVILGQLEDDRVFPLLMRALEDPSAVVRRTVGDTLSDLGNPIAIPAMCRALSDRNKLVRWRAARYLFEVGDSTAIPALQKAIHDKEFEVQLQAQIALKRIESGEEASGTVWQQMMREMEK
ncbi:conserved virulence factor C family protein [Thermoactinomyces sp. DSM 45892]|uniref:conserved virulence factor C family protein n=1 Tax=Thermoactinomyces sp. DSM 45892 TaxID=1882753 RepID=UPI000B858BAB|nr:conserved virulence factor C family protein [Thermoactinomyces sp. DSM 45892]